MILKIQSHKNKIFIFILFLFSIAINQYYGNKGVFPMDSFHFFDSGYKVLNGEVPFVDYWLVKGPLLDYLQAIFFYFFGVNWQSYVLHASLINAILTIFTFVVLKNYNLKSFYCFFYSLLFSILAYPSSATPFIDHHSAFFSLLGIYSFLLAIKNNNKLYWYLIPIFFGFAFFSKQVPASYIIILLSFVLILFSTVKKNLNYIKYLFVSTLVFGVAVFIFGIFQGINFSSFLIQHFLYPQTIGAERFLNLDISYKNIIENFILIYLAAIPFVYENIKKIFFNKKYIKESDFYAFLSIIIFTISLIFHQLLTKNQIFIFFLIPILAAFSHISLLKMEANLKSGLCILVIFLSVFSTYKYHFRYNEGRKFHELKNVDFNLAVEAKQIDKKLSGLNWITPQFSDNPQKEIELINQVKNILAEDKRTKILITNYPFYSVILNQKISSPSRIYTGDGTTHPIKGNKYTEKYKELMHNLILKNNISVIYKTNIANHEFNFNYIDSYRHCYEKKIISEQLTEYNLENCN